MFPPTDLVNSCNINTIIIINNIYGHPQPPPCNKMLIVNNVIEVLLLYCVTSVSTDDSVILFFKIKAITI